MATVETATASVLRNIDAQHEDVLQALEIYWREQSHGISRVMRLYFRHPIAYMKIALRMLAQRKQSPKDLLTGSTPEGLREAWKQIALHYPDANHEVLDDLLADFSVHVIADRIATKFPTYDFAKIKKLHDSRRNLRLRLTTNQFLAVALTGVAFVGKWVPTAVIAGDIGWSSDQFDRAVFYLTTPIVGFFALLVVLEWFGLWRAREKHEYFGTILSYLELASGTVAKA